MVYWWWGYASLAGARVLLLSHCSCAYEVALADVCAGALSCYGGGWLTCPNDRSACGSFGLVATLVAARSGMRACAARRCRCALRRPALWDAVVRRVVRRPSPLLLFFGLSRASRSLMLLARPHSPLPPGAASAWPQSGPCLPGWLLLPVCPPRSSVLAGRCAAYAAARAFVPALPRRAPCSCLSRSPFGGSPRRAWLPVLCRAGWPSS